MYRLIALLIGYLFGMFQTAYFVGKMSGIDIREHGSKSAGFTNTNRVLGRKAGLIVFFADVLKTIIAVLVVTLIPGGSYIAGLYAGFGSIIGHIFPFFLKFKGGKGISCTLGLIIMTDWRVMLISFAIGIVLVLVFRYISLASLAITLVTPILMFAFGFQTEAVLLMFGITALTWFKHRANIVRLIKGEESRFSLRK